jgi:ketosteroid isomerase-like protein
MTYLSEDPTLLAGGLLVLAVAYAVALRATQQGKYLIRAAIAAALAAGVVVIEWVWVTDNERIEQVVYGLRQAVLDSDVEKVLSYMTPDVLYTKGDLSVDGEATRELIRSNLGRAHFEFVQISNLQVNAGAQSRRGTADFRVFAKGTLDTSLATMNIGTANSIWSLGLQETAPGVWKVNRITPVQIPNGTLTVPSRSQAVDRSSGGTDDGTGGPHRKFGRVPGRPSGPRVVRPE